MTVVVSDDLLLIACSAIWMYMLGSALLVVSQILDCPSHQGSMFELNAGRAFVIVGQDPLMDFLDDMMDGERGGYARSNLFEMLLPKEVSELGSSAGYLPDFSDRRHFLISEHDIRLFRRDCAFIKRLPSHDRDLTTVVFGIRSSMMTHHHCSR